MLREIDRRVCFLQKRFRGTKNSHTTPLRHQQVVGPDELDLQKGLISLDAPLARALLGKSVAAQVSVQTPAGLCFWRVIDIEYQN